MRDNGFTKENTPFSPGLLLQPLEPRQRPCTAKMTSKLDPGIDISIILTSGQLDSFGV
jgi:hypothetical protein